MRRVISCQAIAISSPPSPPVDIDFLPNPISSSNEQRIVIVLNLLPNILIQIVCKIPEAVAYMLDLNKFMQLNEKKKNI